MIESRFCSYNANPKNKRIGDCVIRAISTALGRSWEDVYIDLCVDGLMSYELPNSDLLWGEYLKRNGFRRGILSCENGLCVTVNDFCEMNPQGVFIVCPTNHVVAVIDGLFYDTWDCGNEIINYYWERAKER